jgi:hypothetical protein
MSDAESGSAPGAGVAPHAERRLHHQPTEMLRRVPTSLSRTRGRTCRCSSSCAELSALSGFKTRFALREIMRKAKRELRPLGLTASDSLGE